MLSSDWPFGASPSTATAALPSTYGLVDDRLASMLFGQTAHPSSSAGFADAAFRPQPSVVAARPEDRLDWDDAAIPPRSISLPLAPTSVDGDTRNRQAHRTADGHTGDRSYDDPRLVDGRQQWPNQTARYDSSAMSTQPQDSRMWNSPRPGVCFDYQQGRCTRAVCRYSHDVSGRSRSPTQRPYPREFGYSNARPAMSFQERRAPSPASAVGGGNVCFDFQRGNCSRMHCRFSHGVAPGRNVAASTHGGPSSGGGYRQGRYELDGQGNVDGGGRASHDYYGTQRPRAESDASWSSNSSYRGPFHRSPPSQAATGYGYARSRSPQACFAFQRGNCTYGASCRFQHDLVRATASARW